MAAREHSRRTRREVAQYRIVMWLRDHRRGIRTTFSGAALSAVTVAALAGISWVWQEYPPPGAPVGPDAVFRLSLSLQLWWGVGIVFTAGALLRWLITDRNLEWARDRAGDATVIPAVRYATEVAPEAFPADLMSADPLAPSEAASYLDSRRAISSRLANSRLRAIVGDGEHPPRGVFRRLLKRPVPTPHRSEQAAVTAVWTSLVVPDTVFTRLSERRILGDERASVVVSRTIEGRDELRDLILVPVLSIPKGSLVGALSITVDGKKGRSLPTVESRGLLMQMLQDRVVDVAAGLSERHQQRLRTFGIYAARGIVSDTPVSASARRKWIEMGEAVLNEANAGAKGEWLPALSNLALANDIIFAVVPQGCAETIKIEISYTEPYRERVDGPVDRVRRLVGIGPSEFKIDLHRVAEANSYHLDVVSDSNTYVEEASVIFSASRPADQAARRAPQLENEPVQSEVIQVAPLRGDAQAHVYWRDYRRDGITAGAAGGDGEIVPQFYLRLRERPPGVLGPAWMLSIWTTFLTWTVGYFYPVLFATGGSAGSSVWTTVILAAPAILTGWLLSRLTAESMRIISISTFVLVSTLGVIVATLVGISALTMSRVRMPEWSIGSVVVAEHPEWLFLMLVTLLHALACGLLFVGRGLRYANTINERAGE